MKIEGEAGNFSVITNKQTYTTKIVVIGIGAGNRCDGQVLVLHDMLGLNQGFKPKFLRQFAHLNEEVHKALTAYVEAVKDSSFPSPEESY